MKLFLLLFIFNLVFIVYGAEMRYAADKNYPGKCYAKEFGILNYGETIFVKPCARAMCGAGDIVLQTCGVAITPCGTIQDLSKNYPDCCPMPKVC